MSAALYRFFFSRVLSRLDPERTHDMAILALRLMHASGFGRFVRRQTRPHPKLAVETMGLRFDSPFGMAAGFDKNAKVTNALGELGFGHVEVGTVTALPQSGNPRPRMFRLIADRALINRMGFNNEGAERVARRIASRKATPGRPIVGINIGKSRVVDPTDAIADYCASTRKLAPLADYLVVNVSSPNTPGLRDLQNIASLRPLLRSVKDSAASTPLLVKIAPDLADADIDQIAELVIECGLDGIVATNTTTTREGLNAGNEVIEEIGAGGLSGVPLRARSLEILHLLKKVLPASVCIVSVGGITTSADVAERLDAGATLVQGYSAFIYEGPLWARRINRDLYRMRIARSRA